MALWMVSLFYAEQLILQNFSRILCVARELTDGSRRGVGRTTHKMNWTKPLGRGAWPLAD